MSKKNALIVWGGWEGHQPESVANFLAEILNQEGFAVTISPTLDSFADEDLVCAQDLLVPVITMSEITNEQFEPVRKAIAEHG
ncbi:MAG: hypothetical protein WCG75_05655, partial [Armatimonadota bacterium]